MQDVMLERMEGGEREGLRVALGCARLYGAGTRTTYSLCLRYPVSTSRGSARENSPPAYGNFRYLGDKFFFSLFKLF